MNDHDDRLFRKYLHHHLVNEYGMNDEMNVHAIHDHEYDYDVHDHMNVLNEENAVDVLHVVELDVYTFHKQNGFHLLNVVYIVNCMTKELLRFFVVGLIVDLN